MSFIVSFQAARCADGEDCLPFEVVKHVIWTSNGRILALMYLQRPGALGYRRLSKRAALQKRRRESGAAAAPVRLL